MMFHEQFEIKENSALGRYVISKKEFKQGETVWEESPLLSSPSSRQEGVPAEIVPQLSCVVCGNTVIDEEKMKCVDCGWPCCSPECAQNELHKSFECGLFREREIVVSQSTYTRIRFIRFALYKTKAPEKYEKLLGLSSEWAAMDFQVQMALAKKVMSLWNFLAFECKLDITMTEVSTLFRIFRNNAFAFNVAAQNDYSGYTGNVLYEKSSLFSHSCCPNMEFSFFNRIEENGDTQLNIRFHARRNIEKGEVLSMAYGYPELQLGTISRLKKILETRHFLCKCERCQDETEGGTYFSALICPKCGDGFLLTTNPMDPKSKWKCDTCNGIQRARLVSRMLDSLRRDSHFKLGGMNEADAESLSFADNFIDNQSGYILHPNHYLIYQCGVHWLTNTGFTSRLVVYEPDADVQEIATFFTKVMKRFKRFFPIAVRFQPADIVSKLYFRLAQVLSAFVFKSRDLRSIGRYGVPPKDEVRIGKRVLGALKYSKTWLTMKPNCIDYEVQLLYLDELISIWSRWVEKFCFEINTLQDLSLESLPSLFL